MSISAVVSVSSISSISSAISMTSVTGLAVGGVMATILLIVLLSSQEIISASSHWNNKLLKSFYMATLPLLFIFVEIVVYRILDIL